MDERRMMLIRERAHQIWEEEGRPSGRDGEHWAQAERELAADGGRMDGDALIGMATGPQPGEYPLATGSGDAPPAAGPAQTAARNTGTRRKKGAAAQG